MDCDCSCEADSPCDIYQATTRRARKRYQCCECDDTIRPGESYEYASFLWEGDWGNARTCLVCVLIRERYCPNGSYHGGLAKQLSECLGFSHLEIPEDDE